MNEITQNVLKTDLRLNQQSSGVWDIVDLNGIDYEEQTISDVDNLIQALRLRLLTETGELAAIDHPDYGSTELRNFIGLNLTIAMKAQMEKIIKEIILQDERVEEVIELDLYQDLSDRHRTNITATIKPIHGEVTNLSVTLDS